MNNLFFMYETYTNGYTANVLDIISLLSVLCAILVITNKNPIVSVLFLISTFVLAPCYLIINGINFISLSYIIVYVGAIAILFLFVVMMINIKTTDTLEIGKQYTKILPLGLTIVTFFLWVFFSLIPYIFSNKLSISGINLFFNSNPITENKTDLAALPVKFCNCGCCNMDGQ